ncbi:MAG: YczE/YyaS/YitT family protein [Sphaerochaetaceae bacterium]
MKREIGRLARLFIGLFFYALGIVLTMQAHIGYSPWDVFHAGLSTLFSMKIGTMTILVGLLLGFVVLLGGERIGVGTLCNMVLIGLFINILLDSGLFSERSHLISGSLQMVFGLFVISFASYLYISSGYGAGPRDSLMVFLSRKTGFSAGTCRAVLEVAVSVIGFLLGGMLGWGTLLSAVLIGLCIQITFNVLHFDPKEIHHENLGESFQRALHFVRRSR